MPAKDPSSRIKSALRALQQAADPMDKLRAARGVREAAEDLEITAIADARANSATWTQIGSCYGLSKQGAQQRFRTPAKEGAVPSPKKGAPGKSART